ncbi:anti-sigma factor domain-containing protein [Streptosporangium sp. DT93]|uniref:anti-sigma factor n=1 Tax=Streptosporangium sp. DT93 TaxID=3393428 RepID=UPI003CE7CE86
MHHPNDDTLALIALGEEADSAHLATCPDCRERLDGLVQVVSAVRRGPLEHPGPGVWEGVRAELGLSPGLLPGPAARSAPAASLPGAPLPAAPPVRAEPVPSGPDAQDGSVDPGAPAAPAAPAVTPTRPRPLRPSRQAGRGAVGPRAGRRVRLLTAIAAGLVAGIGGTLLFQGLTSDRDTVVSQTVLAALPGKQGDGVAELRTGADGDRLRVRLSGLPAPDGFYEVWLLDRAAKRMISLGTLDPSGQASYSLPADVRTADYPVVDVSREPLDGNPGHSSDSFLRGTLHG